MTFKLDITQEGGLPMHLGGHEEMQHYDEGGLDYLINTFGIKSMVDVGCGLGGMVQMARSKGLDAIGIDGDFVVKRDLDDVIIHDYTTGPYILDKKYDLAYTCEFVEHVDEMYMRNFVSTWDSCKYVLMTHALPGQPGHNHVNCQTIEYWIHVLNAFGFTFDPETTMEIRKSSTMLERYIREQSLFLHNRNWDNT